MAGKECMEKQQSSEPMRTFLKNHSIGPEGRLSLEVKYIPVIPNKSIGSRLGNEYERSGCLRSKPSPKLRAADRVALFRRLFMGEGLAKKERHS